jgi:hypothetical protein
MAKKPVDPKQKAKRQKVMIACLAPLFLGLLAFQLPRTLKMLHQQSAAANTTPAPASSTPGTTTPLAPPSLDGSSGGGGGAAAGGSGGSSKASADGIVDPAGSLPAGAGQLITFDRFRSKDPFRQQIDNCGADCASPSALKASLRTPAPKPRTVVPNTRRPKPTPPPPPTPMKVTSATISVNGVQEQVAVGKAFPAADPVFVLVSLTPKAAKIAISGGDLEGGAATVTLRKGKPLKLVNTADGTEYDLQLLATA